MVFSWEEISNLHKQKERLAVISEEVFDICQGFNMNEVGKHLDEQKKTMLEKPLRILVVGKFACGKSTLINALLGEALLPTYALPSLEPITMIKYGESEETVLYFPAQLQEPKTIEIFPTKIKNHLQQYGLKNVPPLHISYKELNDCLTGISDDIHPAMWGYQLYEKLELIGPYSILKDGVEIVTLPGLEDAMTIRHLESGILTNSDAILFVMSADCLCSMVEMEFVKEYLLTRVNESTFFAVNRYDLVPDKYKAEIKRFTKIKFGDSTTNEILFVSALQAMDAIENGNEILYEKSGMGLLASKIEKYLVQSKGHKTLLYYCRMLNHLLKNNMLFTVIPEERTMLNSSLNEVKAHNQSTELQLEKVRQKRTLVLNKMALRKEQILDEIRRTIEKHFAVLESNLPIWIAGYEPHNRIGIVLTPKSVQLIFNEILEFAEKKLQETNFTFETNDWQPLLKIRIQRFVDAAESDIKEAGIELINNIFEPFSIEINQHLNADYFILTPYIIQYPFVPPFALGPWFLPILSAFGGSSISKMPKLKSKISGLLVDNLRISAREIIPKIVKQIDKSMSDYLEMLSEVLKKKIAQRERQAKDIVDRLHQGQTSIDARKQVLDEYEVRCRMLVEQLDELIYELI